MSWYCLRVDATRVTVAIPLRESFALPFIAVQICSTIAYLKHRDVGQLYKVCTHSHVNCDVSMCCECVYMYVHVLDLSLHVFCVCMYVLCMHVCTGYGLVCVCTYIYCVYVTCVM